jgi:hypothetical protein
MNAPFGSAQGAFISAQGAFGSSLSGVEFVERSRNELKTVIQKVHFSWHIGLNLSLTNGPLSFL